MHRTLVTLAVVAALAFPADLHAARSRARAVDPADEAFSSAKEAYLSLKADPKRRKYRDQWLAIAKRFETVANKHTRSPRAADALFNMASLYSDLYRVSLSHKDLRASIDAWERLYSKYPKSTLADDAHLERARIFRDRKGDIATARIELRAAIACKGDKVKVARQELSELGPAGRDEKAHQADPPERSHAKQQPQQVAEASTVDRERARELTRQLNRVAPRAARHDRVLEGMAQAARGNVESEGQDSADDEDDEREESVPAPQLPPVVQAAPAAQPAGGLDRERLRTIERASHDQVPLSVQAGLKVRRVIIDAGHGGHDTGAIGTDGTLEKDITLAIALKLKARLEAQGYQALLTREDDHFVALEDRARFANHNKGDLFVSVHCNAAKSHKLHGTETYTLNVSSDRYAIRLAARENASSERSLNDLQFILADLATKANTEESTRLAKAIQPRVVDAMGTSDKEARSLGVKQALFYVLLGVRMPSVLVETAFLSYPQEEKALKSPDRQTAIANAIASGIERFVSEREQLASVDLDIE
jgi:N-acetylmuramoyl-L-alanine amidase